jgi:hypothetical protein
MRPPLTVIRNFITPAEQAQLLALWATAQERAVQNQRGYSYIGLDIHEPPQHLIDRACALMGFPTCPQGTTDTFFLHHENGAATRAHQDYNRICRLNVIVKAPQDGGLFYVDDQLADVGENDAVIFLPALIHFLTPIVGERLIWSVGIHVA